jgi:hypothetical protein
MHKHLIGSHVKGGYVMGRHAMGGHLMGGHLIRYSMNRNDLHRGLWVYRSLLDSALRQLRRVERELGAEKTARDIRAGSRYRLKQYLATYMRAGFHQANHLPCVANHVRE